MDEWLRDLEGYWLVSLSGSEARETPDAPGHRKAKRYRVVASASCDSVTGLIPISMVLLSESICFGSGASACAFRAVHGSLIATGRCEHPCPRPGRCFYRKGLETGFDLLILTL